MASRDLKNNVDSKQSLTPAAHAATADGTGIDTAGYESATFVVHAGTWTDGTHTLKAQDSDDDITYADVTAANLIGSFSAIVADDASPPDGVNEEVDQRVGYKGGKRYVRAVTTVAGASTGAVYGVSVVLGHPASAPV